MTRLPAYIYIGVALVACVFLWFMFSPDGVEDTTSLPHQQVIRDTLIIHDTVREVVTSPPIIVRKKDVEHIVRTERAQVIIHSRDTLQIDSVQVMTHADTVFIREKIMIPQPERTRVWVSAGLYDRLPGAGIEVERRRFGVGVHVLPGGLGMSLKYRLR